VWWPAWSPRCPFFLWVFNVPPPFTFRFTDTTDVAAILTTGAITSGLVVVTEVLIRRERRATEHRVRLGQEVDTQRSTIAALQRALLPDAVPSVPGLTIGWHYVSGGVPSVPVGGDWLAFVPIGTSALGIAVGDVAGHGLAAVRAMAQCRVALRVLASDGADPSAVLGRLDTVVSRLGDGILSTCLYGVIDADRATWTYASAGHPPALLRRGGSTVVLGARHGPPIGAELWGDRPVPSTVVAVGDGDIVALYTDGLVERRHVPIDLGIAKLAHRIELAGDVLDAPETCRAIVRDLAGASPADDVAIALVRVTASRGRRS